LTRSIAAALCAATFLLPSAGFSGTDALPPERVKAIAVAFDRALADPAMDPDRLSPVRLAAMRLAYDTHAVRPDADRLSPADWASIRAAYRTHGPSRDIVALAR
jgi:hypothetical protein